jgi:hypothetical protein
VQINRSLETPAVVVRQSHKEMSGNEAGQDLVITTGIDDDSNHHLFWWRLLGLALRMSVIKRLSQHLPEPGTYSPWRH